jgi:uncharacterized protein YdaU (DUF1376 family)
MATPKPTTSPAFQFYPRDFLSSPKVARMSLTEIGIYIKLLSHCWLNNGLPAEVGKLAGMVGMKPKQFERIWSNVLCECFYERGGRLLNERLDEERKKQADYKRRQSDRASVRWENRRKTHAAALPEAASSGIDRVVPAQCSSSSSSSSSSKRAVPIARPRRMNAAFEGPRVWVLQSQHEDFLRMRNSPLAEGELQSWYLTVSDEWTEGARKAEEVGGDMFAFWRARYAEKWPAAKAQAATAERRSNVPDAAASRARRQEMFGNG